MVRAIAGVAVLALSLSAYGSGVDEHVLAGARHFRQNRFSEALVEFRVAERLGSRQARGYSAAALVKLERPEEALEIFEGPEVLSTERDALLDFYHALACYESRLYLRADELLATISPRTGPRVAAQAGKIRADIANLIVREPGPETVDWYLARADGYERAGRLVLARAFAREARALGARRADGHGASDAAARLNRLGRAKADPLR